MSIFLYIIRYVAESWFATVRAWENFRYDDKQNAGSSETFDDNNEFSNRTLAVLQSTHDGNASQEDGLDSDFLSGKGRKDKNGMITRSLSLPAANNAV